MGVFVIWSHNYIDGFKGINLYYSSISREGRYGGAEIASIAFIAMGVIAIKKAFQMRKEDKAKFGRLKA